jgi:predicted DsbA family dithiol-disulfide isomerase
MMTTKLHIDIVSDIACPWCVIGYGSLAAALKNLESICTAEICWKPFELNPAMEKEGELLSEHLYKKYGASKEDLSKTTQQITERGAALGFKFNFGEKSRIYNTFDAHRLLYWAKDQGKQTELKFAFFELYFTAGGNPANTEQLMGVVEKVGLNKAEASEVLDTDRYIKEVREEQAKYLALEIRSVPTFIINNQYKITGGQPVDMFIETLKKIVAEQG